MTCSFESLMGTEDFERASFKAAGALSQQLLAK